MIIKQLNILIGKKIKHISGKYEKLKVITEEDGELFFKSVGGPCDCCSTAPYIDSIEDVDNILNEKIEYITQERLEGEDREYQRIGTDEIYTIFLKSQKGSCKIMISDYGRGLKLVQKDWEEEGW